MTIIDLKSADDTILQQYVDLRNSYVELLLTESVELAGTKAWVQNSDIEAVALVDDKILVAAAVLYVSRGGEVALFSKVRGKGFGGMALRAVEAVAIKRCLKSIWAWVRSDNEIAKKVFLKNGFSFESYFKRSFRGGVVEGGVFRKKF